ncbi:hypothetical protein C8N40_11294 [Pontibacter mucosus]|uniref:Uncharacterized protein n=1 Tax=Pontibacter mucosus TaxID=1649266 RepID=A0A2T5YCN4_9BACT|nr:hypothetical protein [Pontibacter mucosus]PTX14247.1 hypothetical protein C8N40_11294 [Pontibacter mucosus]
MEELVQLVDVLKTGYNKESLFKKGRKESKEYRFIHLIANGVHASDAALAQELYNTSPDDFRYKMLKHRVKSKLYDLLLLYEYEDTETNLVYRKEQFCQQVLLKANVLFRNHKFILAAELANKVIAVSDEYSFTNQKVLAYEIILAALSFTGKQKAYDRHLELYNDFLYKKLAEREAQSIYQSVRVSVFKSVKSRKNIVASLNAKVEAVKKLWERAGTYEAFNSYYKLSMLYFELIGDFDRILQLTFESERLIAEGAVNQHRFDSLYNKFILVYAHLRLKKYTAGLRYAKEFVKFFDEKSINWFSFQENFFLLATHSKNYDLAEVTLHQVFSNSLMDKLSVAAKERWRIYQAYYVMLNQSNAASSNLINPFLLSLPEYSKDKQGFNVAILILQFVYYLQKRDTEALLYRIESLKKYILTHLKDTFSLRSKIFLKLLILIVTEDYDVESCRKKGHKLYQKLIETPIPGDAYAEIEIVPYEHLWEHILDTLQTHYK